MSEKTAPFHVARFSQIASSEARGLSLKMKPAIYAWYRTLQLDQATGSADQFLYALESLLSSKLSQPHVKRLGFLYEVSIQESGGTLSRRNWELLEVISADPSARIYLAEVLETATFLQAPLYVGKALDLRRRVGEHIDGATELFSSFEEAGIAIDSLIVRFRYIRRQDIDQLLPKNKLGGKLGHNPADAIAFLIEELLTRLSPSAFVRRPG